MSPKVSSAAIGGHDWEPNPLHLSDFEAEDETGTEVSQGTPTEVAAAEVGEDGQLTSYDLIWLGRQMDKHGRSPKGKLKGSFADSEGNEVPEDTQFRVVIRPENGNWRNALTDWYTQDEISQSNPEHRIPIPPVRDGDDDPVLAREGRYLAIEARNMSGDTEVHLGNSTFKIPARMAY